MTHTHQADGTGRTGAGTLPPAIGAARAATTGGPPDFGEAHDAVIPCFSIDEAGLEHETAVPPEDQPTAPAMRWLKLIRSDSGHLTCGVWDCQAGVFDVHFKCDELVHILDGEVTVYTGDAEQTLRTGDVALFHEGLVTRWEVPRYVRKLWLHHFRQPTLRERFEYKLRMWLGRVAGP